MSSNRSKRTNSKFQLRRPAAGQRLTLDSESHVRGGKRDGAVQESRRCYSPPSSKLLNHSRHSVRRKRHVHISEKVGK